MLHAGLDLSRKRLDVCLLSEHGELVEEFSAPPDADGLRGLVRHVGQHGVPSRRLTIAARTRASTRSPTTQHFAHWSRIAFVNDAATFSSKVALS